VSDGTFLSKVHERCTAIVPIPCRPALHIN